MNQFIASKKFANNSGNLLLSAVPKRLMSSASLDAIAIAKLVSLSEASAARKGNRVVPRRIAPDQIL